MVCRAESPLDEGDEMRSKPAVMERLITTFDCILRGLRVSAAEIERLGKLDWPGWAASFN